MATLFTPCVTDKNFYGRAVREPKWHFEIDGSTGQVTGRLENAKGQHLEWDALRGKWVGVPA